MTYAAFRSAALAALLAGTALPASAETIQVTVASGHPAVFLWVKHLGETFIPTVDAELAKTGEVEIEWTEAYGGTLMKLGAEADSMRDGIVDIAVASGVFDPAQMGILNVTYAMPFGPTDPRMVTEAVEEAFANTEGLLDELAEASGVVYLGGGIAIDGYNIAATKPFTSRADMEGIKIGGAGPNLAWLDTTGAVGVQGSYVSFYNDIKTGVYDGMIGWMTANAPSKMWEVAPYFNKVDFGAMYIGGLGISQDRWDSFSDETKAAFRTAAAAYQDAYFNEQAARFDAAQEAMIAGGGEIVEMAPEARSAWIAEVKNPTTAWRAAAEARGEPAEAVLKAYQEALAKRGFTFERDYLAD
ncbi:C4-dicarboxylate TRAP transporter substrate-binding protein [Mesobacterium pallidum]|uniref:C4-dicarboxylate TRAP transporter substrate-binding protein n=1 Tax=Mesobacterium pallidum TaxID=2872037 RepID=UPI001EE1A96F|nr:C4-dicarboxylate TRAP transporter substrate-binding protein [Mesobacterium pallidum]